MEEHFEAGLEAGRHADQLTRAGQPGHGRHHAAEALDGVLRAIGEAADSLHFAPRFLAEATELVDEPTHRSEEHTSDSSHGYISYAAFCLKKKNSRHSYCAA